MIENKECYAFNEAESVIVKGFATIKDGVQIAKGFVGISEEELMELYNTDKELAEKDNRLSALLNQEQAEPELTLAEQQEARETYIMAML